MKTIISLLTILLFLPCVYGQSKPLNKPSKNVQVVVNNEDATSELLPIEVGMSPNLTGAKIGIKYFGIKSESDISFILILKGTKSIYSSGASFGVKMYVDDVPLLKNKYRSVQSVDKNGAEEVLRFYITTEDLAWMATGNKVSITIFNIETDKKHDTLFLTPALMKEFKDFAKSVYLIRSFME